MLGVRAFKNTDWILLVTVVTLSVIGIAFIWSCTHWVAARSSLARIQFRWLGLSLIALVLVLSIDYARLGQFAYPAYALAFGALILVLVPFIGEVRGHSRRWLQIGPLTAQPSEFAKVAVVLALARYLMYRKNYRTLSGLVIPFLITLLPMGLILKEPDLGTALVFLPTLFVMLYVAGARPRHLVAVAAAGLACAPLLWFFVMGARQKGRIIGFLWPDKYPLGAGWHVRQSVAAVASGGWTGNGFASGSPVLLNRGFAAHTDFIYSTIAHEWGFLGALAVLFLFLILLTRCAEIAARTREPFGRLVAAGMTAMLAFQTLVNLGMTVRFCPITGLTLPFVSYGGSSLLTCFVMIAFVLNVGMHRKPVVAPEDFAS